MSPRHQILEQLYLDLAPRWRAIAGKALPCAADQQDAVQNAFAKCLKGPVSKFNNLEHARRFVALAVYHSAIDLARWNSRLRQRFRPLDLTELDRWTGFRRSGVRPRPRRGEAS